MHSWRPRLVTAKLRLLLPRRVSDQLVNSLKAAGDRETGGILMGEQIKEGYFRIIEVTVQSDVGTSEHFLRRPCQAEAALSRFLDDTGHDYLRFNYLGEWHSHPSHLMAPSVRDHRTMCELVHDKSIGASFAILLIVSLSCDQRLLTDTSIYASGLRPSKAIVIGEPRANE